MSIILDPLLEVFLIIIDLYTYIIIMGVVLSWLIAFNVVNTYNRLVFALGDFFHKATEPLLMPIRRFLPNFGNVDLSPMVLILGLIFLKGVIQGLHGSYS